MDTPPPLPPIPPPLPPRRSGGKAVWWVFGISVVCAVLFAIPFFNSFRKGYQEAQERRESLREVEQAIANSKSKLREAFDEENGISAEKLAEAGKLMAEKLDQASKSLSGDEGRIMQAGRNYVVNFQGKAAAYNELLKEIEIDKLLDLRSVDLAILDQRRKNVERMLKANAELSEMIRNAEKYFEEELEKGEVAPVARREAMDGFRKGVRAQHELLLKIRATDQDLGEAAIDLLELMSREWGKWEIDQADAVVRFQSDSLVESYGTIMGRIQKASQEQIEAQRALVDAQQASMPSK